MEYITTCDLQGVGRIRERLLKGLAGESSLPVACHIHPRSGVVLALQGRFPAGKDRIAEARAFLDRHRQALGIGRAVLVDEPVTTSAGSGECVTFGAVVAGVPVFRGGVSLIFSQGALTGLTIRLPERNSPRGIAGGPSEAMARRAAVKRLGIDALEDKGNRQFIDRLSLFGETGRSFGWVYRVNADNQVIEIVVSGSDKSPRIDTIATPTDELHCPTGAIPRYSLRSETGTPDFITFGPTGLLLPEAMSGRADAVALALFGRYPRLFGTGDVRTQLRLLRVESDGGARGLSHVVLQQIFAGRPVYGCTLRVHLATSSLAILSVSGVYVRELGTAVRPASVSGSDAVQIAHQAELKRGTDPAELNDFIHARPDLLGPEEVVLPGVLSRVPFANQVCWRVGTPAYDHFVVAHGEQHGQIIFSAPRTNAARIVMEGNREVLRDGTASSGVTPQAASVTLDGLLARVASLFSLYGRNSWDDHGGDLIAIRSPTPVSGTAFWSPADLRVRFSPGSDVGDITAHEFVHGLTQATADLIYLDESGALNEHYSDVFGNLVFPDTPANNWLFGENFNTSRDMANPANFGDPGNYANYVPRANCCASATNIAMLTTACQNSCDNGGVHTNSGIGNLAAVRLCDGDAAHPGVGRPVLAKLFWETLTRRLFAWATYKDELHNTWDVAQNLAAQGAVAPALPWGSDPAAPIDQAVIDQVLWAFRSVGLDLQLTAGWFQVRGEANVTRDITYFQGMTAPPGWRVADHLLATRSPASGVASWSGLVRASGPTTVTSPSGDSTVSFLAGHVGTTDTSFTVRLSNTRYEELGQAPNTTLEADPAAPGGPLPTREPYPDVRLTNWFDNPFFAGRRYDETLRSGQGVVGPGTVVDLFLELYDNRGTVKATHRMGDPDAIWGGTGARITAQSLGGSQLEVGVHSWHDFGWAVRYRIIYVIEHEAGTSVSLPASPPR